MRLDFFVRHQALQYYPSVLNIMWVPYFVTSITMLDLQSSDMRHIACVRYMMSALPLASARRSKLWIPFLNHLLEYAFVPDDLGRFMLKIFHFHIFSLFLVFNHCVMHNDFTNVAASYTATDYRYVTNWVSHQALGQGGRPKGAVPTR